MMTVTNLLDGVTGTNTVSQRLGQRILCVKSDIGKYDMWYGVACKTVMSSSMSAGCSLGGDRDHGDIPHHNDPSNKFLLKLLFFL